jgi:hypothetical protein
MSNEMQRKAMVKLVRLQFKFQCKKGSDDKVVDALSRIAQAISIQGTSTVVKVWIQEVINSYVVDDTTHRLLQELAVVSPNDKGYSLSEGLIKYKKKIWVGENSALRTKITS